MSWRTNSLVLSLRNVGRRFGLNSFIMSLLSSNSYEDKFNRALLSCVKRDDVVWDVGANVGHYTKLFAELTGINGKVFAFEPSPQNYERLAANLKDLENISLFAFGLGDEEKKLTFKQGEDELGATSQVVNVDDVGIDDEQVEIRCGDLIVETGTAGLPNFIKIDVEGFELEVLNGITKILGNRKLKGLGIEVHFGLLKSRGMVDSPKQIELLLEKAGFSCTWPDSSHILALRPK